MNVITTFSAFNQENLREVIDFVASLEFDNHHINLVRGNPKDPLSKDVNLDLYEDAIKYLESVRKEREVNGNPIFVKILHSMKYVARDIVLRTARENKMIL